MSEAINRELDFLLHAITLGVIITFTYDILRIFRRVIKHNLLFISLEDLLFWIACSINIFLMLYRENNGILRWFAVVGALIGMFVYKLLFGRFFVKYVSLLLKKSIQIVSRWLVFCSMPFRKVLRKNRSLALKIRSRTKIAGRMLKKKLTMFFKMIRMILCKQ